MTTETPVAQATTTGKRGRKTGPLAIPYLAKAIVPAFKADIEAVLASNPGTGLTAIYNAYLEATGEPISPNMFRRLLTLSGYSYKRISQIIPTANA